MFKLKNILASALVAALTGFSSLSYAAALPSSVMNSNAAVPPSIVNGADPNVMINLSIETPMQGAAYNDQDDHHNGGPCAGRISSDGGSTFDGTCYFSNKDYLGYFNPRLCYDYAGSIFVPAGPAAADHSCGGNWSGSFLNWASMTAIDEFRWALTGGHRSSDTATTTVLERSNMTLPPGHSWFPYKRLNATINVAPSTVTPYSSTDVYINNNGTQIRFSSDRDTSGDLSGGGLLNVRALVCDGTLETEASTYRNCKKYGSNLKSEGLIQKNASNMRFAVMSYLRDNDHGRHGGVLRANMKYVGKYRPAAGGGIELNTASISPYQTGQEYSDVDGTFLVNPDPADALASDVPNSGVINYINKFGANGYKAYDPIGELYYECLNYFKDRGPTAEFGAGATGGAAILDGFPAVTAGNWQDPIQHQCQQNYIVGINDANPWEDKRLPGTDVLTATYSGYDLRATSEDWGEPSNPDGTLNVTTETNYVGAMQGINGTTRDVGCVPGDCDMVSGPKLIANLGKAFGTAPYSPKENSYYIAGMAYHAASTDIRPDADPNGYPGMQTIQTFMIDTQEYSGSPLTGEMNMLWLAGKYGGFNEKNFVANSASGRTYWPDQTNEWDEDGDGVPDNYVLANDPAKLVAGLTKAFSNIEQRISSGSAAAVISDGITGTGAFYQAIYSPKVRTSAGDEVQWVGQLHSLFIDIVGRLREDGDGDGALDNIATDNIVQLRYNTAPLTGNPRTQVFRYNTQAAYLAGTPTSFAEVDDLKAIWKAREALAGLQNSSIENQRAYANTVTTAGASRYILTWKDNDADRVVDPNEIVPFTAANLDENIMAVVDATEADNVVNFIRGKEDSSLGYRSRTIDYDTSTPGDEVWRLGDIVHSSPVAVGQPDKSFDTLKGDATYTAFRTQYSSRRQVVYVGGNDGMLHAFNSGFYNTGTQGFDLTRAQQPYESVAPTSHPLGAELWAYVPGNLLPHMQWLKEQNYPHLYYVDGSPRSFDVNIFPNDAEHPNGWGTILVVNMRFGGGSVTYDHDGDGGSTTPDITASSAVVVLDVTNPESPPQVLAELSDANLGFTTSRPTLVVQRDAGTGNNFNSPITNNWYLAFGSGPIGSNALTTVTSNQNARMYMYDLKLNQFVQFSGNNYMDLGIANAFVGDPASNNWSADFMDDAIYYGTIEGTVAEPTGGLYRIPLNGSPFGLPSALLLPAATSSPPTPPNQPFPTAPTFSIDQANGDHWVYAGTGRLYVNSDNQSATQQTFYGIKDPGSAGTWGQVQLSDMQEVTGLRVFSGGDMEDPGAVIPTTAITGGDITNTTDSSDFTRFSNYMATKDGWFIDFTLGANSTRSIFASVTFLSFVLFPEYSPPLDQCTPEGSSRLYALYFKTGTAFPGFGLGATVPAKVNTNNDDIETAGVTESIQGIVSTPAIYQSPATASSGGSGKIIACASTAACTDNDLLPITGPTGTSPTGRRSWRELPLQ